MRNFNRASIDLLLNQMTHTALWHTIRLLIAFLMLIGVAGCPFHYVRESHPSPELPKDGYQSLDRFPFREAWYGIYYEDDKIGYSHFRIDRNDNYFVIVFDSVVRLRIGTETKEIDLKESVNVTPDLALASFNSTVLMNKKRMDMRGIVKEGRLEVQLAAVGEEIRRDYDFQGKLYHSSALSLMPALRGIRDGKTYEFLTFNAERQQVEKVEQLISPVTGGQGPKGSVWKVRTVVGGGSIVHSWLNNKGLPVIDKSGAEPIITLLEDEESAKNFLKRNK